jgi:predicted acylesterase/phospholipase RssA
MSGAGASRVTPSAECDVVMKGGITSGVVYPKALSEIGAAYRLRCVGGASAGAIGAAAGAAAEFGRDSGGFDRLNNIPDGLSDGRLARLFQPQPSTRPLLRLLLVATGNDRPNTARSGPRRVAAVIAALFAAFPLASLIGLLLGPALVLCAFVFPGWFGVLLGVLAGVLLGVAGWAVAVALRLKTKLTVDTPANLFGICRGLGADESRPGFTDWLAAHLDDLAGLPAESRPLRFGHLWTGNTEVAAVKPADRAVDLRMISTCLNQGRPYELPVQARLFFYDPQTWRTLFPAQVMDALMQAPAPQPKPGDDEEAWRLEDRAAAAHTPPLHRLPDAQHLPVIVATRMSLSFPLLISAIPLWTIDRRRSQSGPVFAKLWFTDGGLCSNFPVHLFDAALASRPTFAINLGQFSQGQTPSPDQTKNVEYARTNSSGLLPPYQAIPERGFAAVAGFAGAALDTARGWSDSTQLTQPGFRDRIVRVLQTKTEGGMNLHMDTKTIDALATRGQAAGRVMVDQFTQLRYPPSAPIATGWDNHRWMRYRALLASMPAWLASYARGRAALDIDPAKPPAFTMSAPARSLAQQLTDALDAAAAVIANADPEALEQLTEAPRPLGMIRRTPQV